MTKAATIQSIEQYTPGDQKNAERVLAKLHNLYARTSVHAGRRLRRHERKFVTCALEVHPVSNNAAVRSPFRVWSFDVSQSGFGFIAPGEIYDKQLCIGLLIPGGGTNWFLTDVVRKRQIPEEHFWEYGVVIVARVDAPLVVEAQTVESV